MEIVIINGNSKGFWAGRVWNEDITWRNKGMFHFFFVISNKGQIRARMKRSLCPERTLKFLKTHLYLVPLHLPLVPSYFPGGPPVSVTIPRFLRPPFLTSLPKAAAAASFFFNHHLFSWYILLQVLTHFHVFTHPFQTDGVSVMSQE